jgi:WD40 repeat protein
VRCVAFKPDNPNIVVSGSNDRTIKTWDITSGSCLSTLNVGSTVYSVHFSPDGHTVAAGCLNGTVQIIDVATAEVKRPLRGHDLEVMSVSWSPDGTRLASGSLDARVLIWDAASGEQLCSLRGHRYAPSLSKECFLSLG